MRLLTVLFVFCLFGRNLQFITAAKWGWKASVHEDSDNVSEANYESEEEELSPPVRTDSCPIVSLEGIQWILNVRESNYGWKENTHRAIIALAVNDWADIKTDERRLMEQQLEVEITKALLRNGSSPIYPNNLALYIHALIATNRNPRDFHGIDLVERLIEMIRDSSYYSHPFLLLAMCNSKAIDPYYLRALEYHLRNEQDKRQNMEYKALALQAYECAGTLGLELNQSLVNDAQKYLVSQQYLDGSFGNVYTTALILQALSSAQHLQWNKKEAIAYLKKKSSIEINMVSAYLVELALNVDRVRFLKDLFPDLSMGPAAIKVPSRHYVQYSLKVGPDPDVRHTITIRVPPNSNFFDIMKICAEHDSKFNFSYYMDKNNKPSIFAISNIPNDAEENFYWRLCVQSDFEHVNHTFRISTFRPSPIELYPTKEHVIYWYHDKDCENTHSAASY